VAKLRDWIKNYFYFSRAQRNGSLILFAILILVIAANFFLPQYLAPRYKISSDFEAEVRQFEALMQKAKEKDTLTPFSFDPNTLSHEKWIELGLSKRQVDIIFKYKNAGGRFFSKEDVKKMYSISDDEYETLEPFIEIEKTEKKKKSKVKKKPLIEPDPFPFDPNKIAEVDWKKLGFKEYQYQNMLNYLEAGGVFRVKSDLVKMYSISDLDYEKLVDFILLPELDTVQKKQPDKYIPEPVLVEINSADSAELTRLRGIGPSYARRIVKYRSLLGGFYRKDQLLEVFGMDSTRYSGFIDNVALNPLLLEKMDLNEVEFKTLLKHPYVEYYIVKSIFDYRDKHGKFSSVDELKNVPLIYEELYEKFAPYLIIEEFE